MPTKNAIPLQYSNAQLASIFKYGTRAGRTTFRRASSIEPNTSFIEDFTQWIMDSRLNRVRGLEDFHHASFIHGTIQAFDHFYIKHKDRRFKIFPGDFAYHQASLKNGFNVTNTLHSESVESQDAVILSCPFSLNGGQGHYNSLLPMCEHLGVPVLVDMAWLPVATNIDINLDYECIDTVCCSISKAFPGAPNLRVGVRWQREYCDDGIDLANEQRMLPWININIANELINTWKLDDNWNRFGEIYNKVILKYQLTKTNSIIIGLGDEEWIDYERIPGINRVCISDEIGRMINDNNIVT